MTIESDGPSADSALTLTFEEPIVDPFSSTDDSSKLSRVWARCDSLRELLRNQGDPNETERRELKANLIYQLNTIFLYWQAQVFLRALEERRTESRTATLYVLLFPGEAKDNTGIKDLNDKVIGYWWNAEFIQRRFEAIQSIFDTPDSKFAVAAQTYKTAYILTYERTRKDFVKGLKELDGKLRVILLQILEAAEKDPDTDKEKLPEIRKLKKKLKKKSYRFDIFFGMRTLKPGRNPLENTYLLVTEALKAAALARFVAKGKSLKTKAAKEFAKGISPDSRRLDARGKDYDWRTYLSASVRAEKIKNLIVGGYTQASPYDYYQVYIDTVWTVAFLKRKNLYWGNPDVIRDVRKKKLEAAPLKKGNVTYGFPAQKELLELWLVVLNMLDFVKRFMFSEFRKEVIAYHNDALEVFLQLGIASRQIDWVKLERVLTHDVRQKQPIAVFESASEFLFFSYVADYSERIIFSMDIRDMGVELMLDYEHSNREIGYHKYSDVDLMEETFRSSDAIDERRRLTYDKVVEVFKKYYDLLNRSPAGTKTQAQKAFGITAIERLPSFGESVQIMLGGDEVFAAAHPLFAQYVHNIIADLDSIPRLTPFNTLTLNMRAGVAFSSAEKDIDQRRMNQLAHQEGMKLADTALGLLKPLERTQRRIERLIDMLEANPKKKDKGPPYRKELDKLGIMKLFARLKHGDARRLPTKDFRKLLKLMEAGNIKAAEDTGKFQLVDFSGKVINREKLEKDAASLEDRVRRDVGVDNTRQQPPPVNKMPGWMEDVLDCWEDPNCWPY